MSDRPTTHDEIRHTIERCQAVTCNTPEGDVLALLEDVVDDLRSAIGDPRASALAPPETPEPDPSEALRDFTDSLRELAKVAKSGSRDWVGEKQADLMKIAADKLDTSDAARVEAEREVKRLTEQLAKARTDEWPSFESTGWVMLGFNAINFDEFNRVLSETIGASYDYAHGCWPQFLDNPIGYCRTRQPVKQGEALFTLAIERAATIRARSPE